ncbi:MAG TPA: [FeFe] hydrogenase H-cluster radical SAM maturase HydE, partial [Tenuifilaceae bacterium]|nr:[FeFe] hydrogenase H-cluster radical SAM maturase HydE [Tenuifilaceae bacterium]
MNTIDGILSKSELTKEDIILLLQTNTDDRNKLYAKAAEVKEKYVGRKVYFRGLIEMSNICRKNCFYCGIRASNTNTERYSLSDDEIVEASVFAWKNGYASIALQSGELNSPEF